MFKFYTQNQIQLLPADLEEEIELTHLARFVSAVIDEVDLKVIENRYSEKGQNAYHPRMLLKVLVYGYAIGIRSSRKIANSCNENIAFMWLTGRQTPDFRTINDFRKQHLVALKEIFVQVLGTCRELGMIRCGKVSLDGTKMLANANRHKAKYRKQLEGKEKSLEQKVEEILKEADLIDQEEEEIYGDSDSHHLERELSGQEIKATLKKLGKIEKKKEQLDKKLSKLAEQEKDIQAKKEIMRADRNSYANTDPDATCMQMKEDYPAPGYNVQLATEKQVIIAYGVYSNRGDGNLLFQMLEEVKANMGKTPEVAIADCAYGTKKNYQLLDKRKQKYIIPYLAWRKDKGKRKRGEYATTNKDPAWEEKKWEIYSHLKKTENKKILKERGCDVEVAFGDIKHNMGFRRFLLRGREQTETEIGLASLGHNLKKIKTVCTYWMSYLENMLAMTMLRTIQT